mmetsp:Transcript_1539/g.5428  ORF Transcript_1539/g.5428 Transcript_1539/m.5428 type:complete len:228 (+) Transcript_1539:1719-2402(+)
MLDCGDCLALEAALVRHCGAAQRHQLVVDGLVSRLEQVDTDVVQCLLALQHNAHAAVLLGQEEVLVVVDVRGVVPAAACRLSCPSAGDGYLGPVARRRELLERNRLAVALHRGGEREGGVEAGLVRSWDDDVGLAGGRESDGGLHIVQVLELALVDHGVVAEEALALRGALEDVVADVLECLVLAQRNLHRRLAVDVEQVLGVLEPRLIVEAATVRAFLPSVVVRDL